MALTTEQINNINALQAKVNKALENVNAASAANDAARIAAQNCAAARDAKTGGYNKNKACHIDTLSALNNDWNNTANTLEAAKQLYMNAKKELDDYIKLIEKVNEEAAKALMGDASYNASQTAATQAYNVSLSQIEAQKSVALQLAAAEAATKARVAQTEAEQKAKTKKIVIAISIFAGILLLSLIGYAIYKNNKSTSEKTE